MTAQHRAKASVLDLLRQVHGQVQGIPEPVDRSIALHAALAATVEAALNLAEVCEQVWLDEAIRCERVREGYSWTRAAGVAARFAVVEAEDRRRSRLRPV
jgi:alpha-D-ribose 1-methylphosphonate 5-triphosphate synthase subunit PhnH